MQSRGKTSVEEQLAHYRARKKEEEKYKGIKTRFLDTLWSAMPFSRGNSNAPDSELSTSGTEDDQRYEKMRAEALRRRLGASKEQSSGISSDNSDAGVSGMEPNAFSTYTKLEWISLGLKCTMWLILFKMFIILEFGAVFFIFSAFIFIWYNMRSGPKQKGEVSAYSVFNPNCEKIDGTLSAEQLEREILHKI